MRADFQYFVNPADAGSDSPLHQHPLTMDLIHFFRAASMINATTPLNM